MSDDIYPEYTPEEEQLRTPEYREFQENRNQTIAEFVLGLQLDDAMHNHPVLVAIQRQLKRSHDLAIAAIIDTSPHKTDEISRCLVDIKSFVLLKRAFEVILERGKRAKELLDAENKEALSVGNTF